MKKISAIVGVLAAFAINTAAAGSLFACKQENGTIKVQAQACESGQISEVRRRPTMAETEDESVKAHLKLYDEEQEQLAKKKAELATQKDKEWHNWINKCLPVISKGKRLIGQNISVITEACGQAEKENTTVTARGTDVQWIFKSDYVYTTNDIIRAVQSR